MSPAEKATTNSLLTLDQVQSWTGKLAARSETADDASEGVVFHKGDVLSSKLRPYLAKSIRPKRDGVASTEFLVLRPTDHQIDARFLHYYTLSEPFVAWAVATSYGTKMPRSNWDSIGRFELFTPHVEVQRRIADMLDIETARIDTLIEKNERVLTLLQQRWQSLLEQVIFGYASARRVPLWLVCEITPGYAFHSNEFRLEGSVRLLRGINVGVGGIDWRETVYADVSTVESAKEYQLVEGDLVVGMDRPWISAGLRVAQVRAVDEPAYLVQRVARLRPRTGLDRDYLYRALQSRQFYAAFEPLMTGVSVPHVSGGQIGAFKVPLPDLQSQQRIVSHLAKARERSEDLRRAVERQQELLRLRRQSLITAAITGQIEV